MLIDSLNCMPVLLVVYEHVKTNIEALTLAVRLVRFLRDQSPSTRAAARTALSIIRFIREPHEPVAGEPFYFVPFCGL